MSLIKNVAIVGATGSLGSTILDRLVALNKFNITVLRRLDSSLEPPFEGVKVLRVDYQSQESLRTALMGQDAVVSALGTLAVEAQIPLIDAAAAAGVKRFIPSDFGGDFDNPNTRSISVFGAKVKVQDHVIEKSKTTSITYTAIYCSAFLDWGFQYDFTLRISDYKPLLINGGDALFSATYLSTIGDAVVGVLNHPEETKNRSVYVHDVVVSQKRLLEMAKKAAPEKPWEPRVVDLDDMISGAEKRLAAGQLDMEAVMPYVFRVIMDPPFGGRFEKVDNELLGLKPKTEEDVLATLKELIR